MALGGLARAWGFGIEFVADAGRALVDLGRVRSAVMGLGAAIEKLRSGGGQIMGGIGQLGQMAAPLAAALGLAVGYSSSIAENLENQQTAFKVVLGSAEAASAHVKAIRDMAASTPFEEGDLLDGSQRLLTITGKNVERNRELLLLAGNMAALKPGKTVVEAVEALNDAAAGGGFERLREVTGMSLLADDFKKYGRSGGKAWSDAVLKEIADNIKAKTGGQDLLGELGRTTAGRRSTAGDAIKAILGDIGTTFNEQVAKPFYEEVAKLGAEARPIMVKAARDMLGDFSQAWEQYGAPVRDRIRAWWGTLGPEGQQSMGSTLLTIVAIVGALGALAIAGGVVLTVLGAMGTVLGGLLTIGSALFTVIGAVGLPGMLALGVAAAALGAALAFVVIGYQSMSDVGSQVGAEAFGGMIESLQWLGNVGLALVTGFAGGYLAAVGPVVTQMRTELGPVFDALMYALRGLFDAISPGGTKLEDFGSIGEVVGYVIGSMLIPGIHIVTWGIGILANGLTMVIERFGRSILQIRSFGTALFGLATGTLSVSEAIELMMTRVGATIILGLETITTGTARAIDLTMMNMIAFVRAIPGMAAIADGLETARGAIAGQADTVGTALRNQAAGLDARADALEKARGARASVAPTFEIVMPPISVRAEVDGRQLTKAGGDQDTKDGASGKKKRLPPDLKGRVLRNGGEVTALAAGEVL